MIPADLSRLSTLLDEALELPLSEREEWLAALEGEAASLAPVLRELLGRPASKETADLLDRGPAFTVPGAAAAAAAFLAGDAVGPYHLLRLIGQGGMGEVWLAERSDGQLKRQVALKLPVLGLRRGVLVQRFARERDIVGALAHPHIARLYDAGLGDDGQPYLALEYVEGQPITAYCDARQLDTRSRVQLLLQVMDAVQYAHANLVIHRDLKPSNVLVTAEGQAMLLDFGIAKLLAADEASAESTELTQVGGHALTLEYAAPEQVGGWAVSTATDVYALGVLLYELLTGQRPFGGTRRELEAAILGTEPPRPAALPSDLSTIALKALKKAPAERYATVNAMAEDLGRWLRGEPVLAQPDSLAYRVRKFIMRRRVPVAAGSVAALALLASSGAALQQADKARRQASAARQETEHARQEAQRAQAVQGFLLEMFRINSIFQREPQQAQRTTARELLDVAAGRVDEALKDAPKSRIEVLATLGDLYLQLGLPVQAGDMYRRRLELARQVFAPNDRQRAAALLALAGRLYDGPAREEARALLAEARDVLDACGDLNPPERGLLLLQLARFHRFESMHLMLVNADAALAFHRQHAPGDRAQLEAFNVAGAAHMVADDPVGAAALLEEGRALAARLGPGALASLIGDTADLGEVQQSLGLLEASERSRREALAAAEKLYGSGASTTMGFRILLGNFLLEVGRTAEGQALHESVLATMKAKPEGTPPWWPQHARFIMARTLADRGRPDLMEPQQRAGVLDIKDELPLSAAFASRQRVLAEVLEALGRAEEAEPLLDAGEALWLRYSGDGGHSSSLGYYLLLRARLRIAQGRHGEALMLLDRVPASMGVQPPAADRSLVRSNILRARALIGLGRGAAAVAAAEQALAALRASPSPLRLVLLEGPALLALGQAQRLAGDLAGAQTSLDQAVALRSAAEDPLSLGVAEAQLALAHCLLDRGHAPAARAARAALAGAERIRRGHSAFPPSLQALLDSARLRIARTYN